MIKKQISIFILIVIMFCSCNKTLPGFDFDLFRNTSASELAVAVKNQNVQEIERLVKEDSSIVNTLDPKFGHSLLMLAVANNLSKSTAKLLELGADPNEKSEPTSGVNSEIKTAVFIACNKIYNDDCNTQILELLISKGGNINDEIIVQYQNADYYTKETPLMEATKHDCLSMVKKIVQLGADINDYDYKNGKGPLSNCIIHDNLEILEYLVIENKAIIPKFIYVRPAYKGVERQELSLVEFLNEQDYSENSKNHMIKRKIIDYLKNRGDK